MFWLARKLLVPMTAFGLGMWYMADLSAKACTERGGEMKMRVCVGERE